MGIGKRIKEAREMRNMTQAQLADKIGITPSSITNYENGTSHPKEPILYKLMNALSVDANFLFQDEMKANVIAYNAHEESIIETYRSLDSLDKKAVDGLLDTLSEREHQLLKDHPQETEHAYLLQDNKLFMTQYDYGVSAGIGNFLDEWDVPKATVEISDSPIAHQADYILKVDGDSMTPKYADGDRVFVKAQESIGLNEIGIFVIDGKCFLKQYKGSHLHSINPEFDDIAFNENQNIKCVGKVLGKV